MIASGLVGACFFCDDGDGCAISRTGGAPRGWWVFAQTAIAGKPAGAAGEGPESGCEEGIGPETATGAGEAADPGKVAALLKKKMSSEDAGSQGDRLGVMPARPL